MMLSSCGNSSPQAIHYNKDACEFCKMSISVPGFATELVTSKGRIYKFDDLSCMLTYTKANPQVPVLDLYVTRFVAPHEFIKTPDAWFVRHETLKSPMGGNTAAFSDSLAALKFAADARGKVLNWQELQITGTNNNR
jgi:copper chaperone NosL